jgi:hypothetical protein
MPDSPGAGTSGIVQKMNQSADQDNKGGSNLEQMGVQEIRAEISKLGDSAQKIARMAQIAMPSIMVHVAKLVEIGKAMQNDVDQMIQQQQQGATTPQPPPPSPTDAQPVS